MQTVTAEAAAVLTAPAVEVSAGCELIAPDLTLREDISDDLVSGRVNRDVNRDIHGTCQLQIARALVWGVDLVRPYMTLTAGGTTVRFNCGVYLLTTPQRQVGSTPETYDAQGYDRLVLLNRQVGADYTAAAGQTYRAAILAAFTAAGLTGVLIDGAAADSTLPVARSWPLVASSDDPDQTNTPVTWLRVVNDLLTAINFRAVWCDENGLYRCQAYQPPSQRAPEWTFDADDLLAGIVGGDRTVTNDVWAVPNRWVGRWTNRPGGMTSTEGDGIYTVNNVSDGPTSQNSRGLIWPSVIDFEAASQAKLVELVDRRVLADRSVTARYDVTVGPFPPAGHGDIYTYRDLAAGGQRKVQLISHDLDLLGADTRMTWQEVV